MKKIINPFISQTISQNSEIPTPTIPAYLEETYAQCYEDVIIGSMISAYCKKYKCTTEKFTYIEIGANHPINTSSTFLWQKKYGMAGVLVEANPELIPALQKFRPTDTIINAAVYDQDVESIELYVGAENEISSIDERFVSEWSGHKSEDKVRVPAIRVNQLFENIPKDKLVILIIDVESLDLRILHDLDFNKYSPAIIEVEPSDFLPKELVKK